MKPFTQKQDYSDLNETEKKKISSKKTIVAKGELLTMDDIEAVELGFSKMSADTITDMLKKRGYENFELRGSIYNLLDKDYTSPWTQEFPDDIPRPGRNFMVEMKYKF